MNPDLRAGSATAAPSLPLLKQRFVEGKTALLEAFAAGRATAPATARLLRRLTRHVDTTLADL